MSPQPVLQSAVIGLGVGAHQARTLHRHSGSELRWLCDLDPERLRNIGETYPQAQRTTLDAELMADETLDLICIASYDESHFDQVTAALVAGKHVFVEKPICLTEAQAIGIRQQLSAHPRARLSSNLGLRTCPLFATLRAQAQAGAFGTLYHLEADYRWGRPAKLIDGWRARAGFYSIIHGAAIHAVDLLLWIKGQRPVTVSACGHQLALADSALRFNDFALLLMRFEDGSTAKVTAHGGCIHPHFHSLHLFGTLRSFIHETTGSGWIDSTDPAIRVRPEFASYPAKTARSKVLSSFIDSLLHLQAQPLVSEKDAFATMSVCLAAERALNSGQAEVITYF